MEQFGNTGRCLTRGGGGGPSESDAIDMPCQLRCCGCFFRCDCGGGPSIRLAGLCRFQLRDPRQGARSGRHMSYLSNLFRGITVPKIKWQLYIPRLVQIVHRSRRKRRSGWSSARLRTAAP